MLEVDMSTMQLAANERATVIAKANDEFRKAGWGVCLTPGVQALEDVNGLMQAVRAYDRFSEESDPYGEHDFGRLMWHGQTVLWKIDYYNKTLTGGVSPMSPLCQRVLTVMLVSEY